MRAIQHRRPEKPVGVNAIWGVDAKVLVGAAQSSISRSTRILEPRQGVRQLNVDCTYAVKWLLQVVNELDLEPVIHGTAHRLVKEEWGSIGIDARKCTAIRAAGTDGGRKRTNLVKLCGRGKTIASEVAHEQRSRVLVAIQNPLGGTRSVDPSLDTAYPALGERRSYSLLRRRFVEIPDITSVVLINLKKIMRLHVADKIGTQDSARVELALHTDVEL